MECSELKIFPTGYDDGRNLAWTLYQGLWVRKRALRPGPAPRFPKQKWTFAFLPHALSSNLRLPGSGLMQQA